jgi:hypothetical protein
VRDLEVYQPKTPKQPKKVPQKTTKPKISREFQYFQKKKKLEERINRHPQKENLNICYICLVYFPKQPEIIKSHLQGKKHQKKYQKYLVRKSL